MNGNTNNNSPSTMLFHMRFISFEYRVLDRHKHSSANGPVCFDVTSFRYSARRFIVSSYNIENSIDVSELTMQFIVFHELLVKISYSMIVECAIIVNPVPCAIPCSCTNHRRYIAILQYLVHNVSGQFAPGMSRKSLQILQTKNE